MVAYAGRRGGVPVVRARDGTVTRPERVPVTDKLIEERVLQNLIHASPCILPLDEIEPVFAPAVPLGTEVATNAGPIDNLLISPQGYVTVVETKLWRNPQARREVVAQVLDYAKEVAMWSFDDLDQRVRGKNRLSFGDDRAGVVDCIRRAGFADEPAEPDLVDAITRNLRLGRLLLLVVGDGIRESVEDLVDTLGGHPGLRFTFGLVEMPLFRMPGGADGDLLVVPQVIARTAEITRVVVQVNEGRTQPPTIQVDTAITPLQTQNTQRVNLSEEAFVERLAASASPDLAALSKRLMDDTKALGCTIIPRTSSVTVTIPDPTGSRQQLSLFSLYFNGDVVAETSFLPHQLPKIGVSAEIANQYLDRLFGMFEVHRRQIDGREQQLRISLEQLSGRYDEAMSIIAETIAQIKDSAEKAE